MKRKTAGMITCLMTISLILGGCQGNPSSNETIENETDPSAKIIHQMNQTINNRGISFFVKNSQVSSSTVNNFVKRAKSKNIPILQVRETIPNNTSYIKWMTENYQNLANINKKLD